MDWTIDSMFDLLKRRGASDLVFAPGSGAVLWVAGVMEVLDGNAMTAGQIESIFRPLLNEDRRRRYERTGDVDFSTERDGAGRLRLNVHRTNSGMAAAIRFIPSKVPSFETLKLPMKVLELADLPHGLVLVTGGAGTGKSTTLASMIEYINGRYAYHIVTMEDPIEFRFTHARGVVEQREVGLDCESFASALRHVVRQRPDVIMVGEMRDLETIAAALTAAETGHLVLASLHTNSAPQTVDRIIDIFPPNQQRQVRVQLSAALQGVVCQSLFHDERDGGMVPAVELMLCTPAVRRAIRDDETHLLAGMIEMGKSAGMSSMDESIAALVRDGAVAAAAARTRAHNAEKLQKLIA